MLGLDGDVAIGLDEAVERGGRDVAGLEAVTFTVRICAGAGDLDRALVVPVGALRPIDAHPEALVFVDVRLGVRSATIQGALAVAVNSKGAWPLLKTSM